MNSFFVLLALLDIQYNHSIEYHKESGVPCCSYFENGLLCIFI